MYFIGQSKIMNQLAYILPYLYKTKEGRSLLFRGPSGWGKTRMAFMVCNYLTDGEFSYQLGDKFVFDSSKRVHFIDEVHLLPNPEVIYPLIDSEKYVFVLATNDAALLPEALVNRCMEFIFDSYTQEELRQICKGSLKFDLPDELVDYIIDCGGANPRIIKGITGRLNIILNRRPNEVENLNMESFKKFMEDTFGIVDALDAQCIRYLQALVYVGGTASLQTISTMIHVDQNTLRYYVEPILLYRNRIKISNKGRSLI